MAAFQLDKKRFCERRSAGKQSRRAARNSFPACCRSRNHPDLSPPPKCLHICSALIQSRRQSIYLFGPRSGIVAVETAHCFYSQARIPSFFLSTNTKAFA